MTSYSLDYAADQICGDSVEHPKRWLLRRIHTGQIRAYKVGRTYRMTEQDIKDAIAGLYNTNGLDRVYTGRLDVQPTSLTPASLNRRRTS